MPSTYRGNHQTLTGSTLWLTSCHRVYEWYVYAKFVASAKFKKMRPLAWVPCRRFLFFRQHIPTTGLISQAWQNWHGAHQPGNSFGMRGIVLCFLKPKSSFPMLNTDIAYERAVTPRSISWNSWQTAATGNVSTCVKYLLQVQFTDADSHYLHKRKSRQFYWIHA